jgi:hypothetical protein
VPCGFLDILLVIRVVFDEGEQVDRDACEYLCLVYIKIVRCPSGNTR